MMACKFCRAEKKILLTRKNELLLRNERIVVARGFWWDFFDGLASFVFLRIIMSSKGSIFFVENIESLSPTLSGWIICLQFLEGVNNSQARIYPDIIKSRGLFGQANFLFAPLPSYCEYLP